MRKSFRQKIVYSFKMKLLVVVGFYFLLSFETCFCLGKLKGHRWQMFKLKYSKEYENKTEEELR